MKREGTCDALAKDSLTPAATHSELPADTAITLPAMITPLTRRSAIARTAAVTATHYVGTQPPTHYVG